MAAVAGILKRVGWWALVGFLVIGVVGAICWGLLADRAFTTSVATELVRRVDKQLPAKVAFQHLSVDALRGRVAIDGLVLAMPGRPSEKLLTARQLIVDIDRLALLAGRVHIQSLHVVDPDATLIHRGGDRYNLTEIIPKGDPNGGPSFFEIERVTLAGGHLTYLDAPRGVVAELPQLDGTVELDLAKQRVSGRVSSARGWVRLTPAKGSPRRQVIDRLKIGFRKAGPDLGLDEVLIDSGPTQVAARGRLTGLGTSNLGLDLEGLVKTRLDAWRQWLAGTPLEGARLGGDAKADFRLQGTAAAPRLAATIVADGLRYRAIAVDHLDSAFVADRQFIHIERAAARLWGGRLIASGTVPLGKDVPFTGELALSAIDLAVAGRQLAVKGLAGLKGRVEGQLRASGHPEPGRVRAVGWVAADGQLPANGRPLPLVVRSALDWDGTHLRLKELDARALGAHMTAEAQLTPLTKVPAYEVVGQVRGLDLGRLGYLLRVNLPVSGQLGSRFKLAGRDLSRLRPHGMATASVVGVVDAKAAASRHPIPFQANGSLVLTEGSVRVAPAIVEVLGGVLRVHGEVPFARRASTPPLITLSGRNLDLTAINRAYALVPGPLNGRGAVDVEIAGTKIVLSRVAATLGSGRIVAKGTVRLNAKVPAYDLQVAAEQVDLAVIQRALARPLLPVTGLARADLVISGAGSRFSVSGPVAVIGRALVTDPVVPGAKRLLPLSVKGVIVASPRSLQAMPLVATLGPSTLKATGKVDLDGPSNLQVNGDVKDGAALAGMFGLADVRGGALTIAATARGPRGRLAFSAVATLAETAYGDRGRVAGATVDLGGTLGEKLDLHGRVSARDLVWQEQAVRSFAAPFTYVAAARQPGRGMLTVTQAVVQLARGRVLGTGRHDLALGTFDGGVRTESLTMADLPPLPRQGVGPPPTTPLTLVVKGHGTLREPVLELDAGVGGFASGGQHFGVTALHGRLAKQTFALDGHVFDRQYTVQGAGALSGTQSGEIRLGFTQAKLAPLLALLPKSVSGEVKVPVGGEMTGAITINGPLARPAALAIAADFSRLQVSYDDLTLENRGPFRLHVADRRLVLDACHLAGGGTDLVARGAIGGNGASDLGVTGVLDLGLLEKLAPTQFADSSGRAEIDAQLRGTVGAPDLRGALTIRNGNFETRSLPQPVRDLQATIRLQHDRLFIDDLRAALGYTGQISAVGGAELGKDFVPRAMTLQMNAREIALRTPDFDAVANADLAFSGNLEASRLNGLVRVLEGKYTKDIDLTGRLGAKGQATTSTSGTKANAFLRGMDLRVQVVVPEQVSIANNMIKADLRGDLVVLGTPLQPGVVGRAQTLRGQLMFQDRIYQIAEGTVDFIDPGHLKPYVHLVATSTIQGYEIGLTANGTPEAIKLDLSSVPYLPQSDVLTLIATGQTPSQLSQSGANGATTASNFLLGQVAKGVESGVADQGVVDVLRIQPGSIDPAETGGGSLTVGKRLTDKLMITYSQDLTLTPGRTTGRTVIFDYLLTEAVALKLEQDLSGGFNVSARYRIPVR